MGFDLWSTLGVSPRAGVTAAVGALVFAGLARASHPLAQPPRLAHAWPVVERLSPRRAPCVAMIVALAVLTVLAAMAQYAARSPEEALLGAAMAVMGAVLGFAIVYRSRPGPRAASAAVLILVNLVFALRAFLTPR